MDNFTTKKDVSIPWDQFKIQKKKKKKITSLLFKVS